MSEKMMWDFIEFFVVISFFLLIFYSIFEDRLKKLFLNRRSLSEDLLCFHKYFVSRAGWISVGELDIFKKTTMPRFYMKSK